MSSPPLPEEGVTFNGLRVAAFESRRAAEMAALIQTFGGKAFVSPSMREVAIDPNPHAIEFGRQLITGQIDAVIFLTGVGVTQLVEYLGRHLPRERVLSSLQDIVTICRGPKPVEALKRFGLVPSYQVPEPNTWREILGIIDEQLSVLNLHVVVQEYGEPNPGLIAGLEARGARADSLQVYTWRLPEDTGPLRDNVRAIVAGERDVLMFTSAQQLAHLLRIGNDMNTSTRMRDHVNQVVVASIGPTTSEALRHHGWPVDFEAGRSKLGVFVRETAQCSHALLSQKRRPEK
jgi:uroporphyrinogen-III synthase